MKRRSVTFTDSPPEVINSRESLDNIFAPLSHFWLSLSRLDHGNNNKERTVGNKCSQHLERCYFSRSVPDLNKKLHYMSLLPRSHTKNVSGNRVEKNNLQLKHRSNTVYLSTADFGTPLRMQNSWKQVAESICNADRSRKSDEGEFCLQERKQENSCIPLSGEDQNITVVVESFSDNITDNDSDVCNTYSFIVNQKHEDSTTDKKETSLECNGAKHAAYVGDKDSSYITSKQKYAINSGKGKNRAEIDHRTVTREFLQRHRSRHLLDYKKLEMATRNGTALSTANKNWSWNNVDRVSGYGYSSLNKLSQQKSLHRHHSTNGINKLFSITRSSVIKNMRITYEWRHSKIYSKGQQRIVDGEFILCFFSEMAKHIAECLEQFNTVLDKVLQARQLVNITFLIPYRLKNEKMFLETSPDLPVDDRETMLRLLNQAMRTGRKRMECSDDRYDPDGRHSESPNSLLGQR
ncbi:unnamed protein product [Thelazia callipaeda]|uniref:Costars domain-containing protein n=1 Tax=Thelazia callipaeda TaxID=103827 RepID=A0A0N5D4S6_THECL|nr:unnamed protein product [Thelazia callipaeda]